MAANRRTDPLIGRIFDERYEVLDRIGKGGMGSVYRAQQLSMGRSVALKVLNPDLMDSEEAAGRFVREAKVASKLKHPNTIVIHDFGQSEDGLFMALELLEGDTLTDRLKQGRMAPEDAARIAIAIARSLAEAHALGIVHRDLKPANIFLHAVHGAEMVKVLDFGIAKFVQDTARADDETMFQTGKPMILGTIHYMSPEQVNGAELDGRSDLYSLGVILYEALSGRRPFVGDNVVMILRDHLESPPPPLPTELPEALRALTMQLLAKDPNDRPKRAEDLADSLETWLGNALGQRGRVRTHPGLSLKLPTQPLTPDEVDHQAATVAVADDRSGASPVDQQFAKVEESQLEQAGWGEFRTVRKEPVAADNGVGELTAAEQAELRPASVQKALDDAKQRPRRGPGAGVFLGVVILAMVAAGAYYYLNVMGGTAAQEPGRIQLVTEPPGAEVRDAATDKVLGTSPGLVLASGDGAPKAITIRLSGYRKLTRNLAYPAGGELLTVDVELEETPRVPLLTRPEGATVTWVERQQAIGKTPWTWPLPDELPEFVTLEFRLDGYNTRTERVSRTDLEFARPVDLVLKSADTKRSPRRR